MGEGVQNLGPIEIPRVVPGIVSSWDKGWTGHLPETWGSAACRPLVASEELSSKEAAQGSPVSGISLRELSQSPHVHTPDITALFIPHILKTGPVVGGRQSNRRQFTISKALFSQPPPPPPARKTLYAQGVGRPVFWLQLHPKSME